MDTVGFEEFLETQDLLNPDVERVVIDETGKMELFSSRFRTLVHDALNSNKQMLATIPIKGNDFIRKIKQRRDTWVVEVTHANRNWLLREIVKDL